TLNGLLQRWVAPELVAPKSQSPLYFVFVCNASKSKDPWLSLGNLEQGWRTFKFNVIPNEGSSLFYMTRDVL
ncbi:hypothetical protein U1Q18_045352, partial [Sarracenia purpurea var. burkii]